MGIKGIYKEIGSGERIALCKLAVDKLEETGRPLRLAIDFSIWQFQVQAARGGSNPAIRTLFYRLVRLLGLAIHPIFVFDGPNKPAFKRNKRSSGRGDAVATAMAKRLIRLFGFAMHDAPGEAEAECALLERQGVVDAVLSEDVDTIMFGCRQTLRNWSAEGPRGSRTPTHVSMYDARRVAAGPSGLDREGMVLVALMSGGDYVPEGVPGCGIKVACEAARAGFGRDLCRIKRADRDGLVAWKERLLHELRTNESGFFRTRHKALEIPDSFPNMEVLRYYTHPVVSRESTVERLKRDFPRASAVDVEGLREFARETFDWSFRIGAVKLIRVLAPNLLVQQFLDRAQSPEKHSDDLDLKQTEESAMVKAISSRRVHFSTDATPELRISFIPADIVRLDLDGEPEEEVEAYGRSGIALNSDDEFDEEAADEVGGEQAKSSSVKKPFDPLQPDLTWIPEILAKLGIPLTVEDWEAKQRAKEQRAAARATRKTRTVKPGMPVGAMDKFVKVTKPGAESTTGKEAPGLELAGSPPKISSQCNPPAPKGRSKQSKKAPASSQAKPAVRVNPWTLASSQATSSTPRPLPPSTAQVQSKPNSASEPIVLSSSPVAPRSPPAAGAGLNESQTTPTKPTRAQRAGHSPEVNSLPVLLLNESPDSKEQHPPDSPGLPKAVSPPTRKTMPPKGAKNGAGGSAATSATQQRIKAFSRVVKNLSSTQADRKAGTVAAQAIEILSDSEDSSPPPTRPIPASIPKQSLRKTTPPALETDIGDSTDDDLFTALPRAKSSNRPSTPAAAAAAGGRGRGQARATNPTSSLRGSSPPASPPRPIRVHTQRSPERTTTRVYLPRTSPGYFREIEVRRDEADRVLAAYNGDDGEGRGTFARRRAWRLSEIDIFDLTGED